MREAAKFLAGFAVLAVVLGGVAPARSQQSKPPYTLAEYNDYFATTRLENPSERAQAIEQFIKTYPQSALRAFAYPDYAQVAWAQKRYPVVMQASVDFLALDRQQVENLYRQSNFNDLQIHYKYYQAALFYAYAYLQPTKENGAAAEATAAQAMDMARRGQELYATFYGQVPAPEDPAQRQQLEQTKQQEETVFHQVMLAAAVRKKDNNVAAREYAWMLERTPNEAGLNYQYARILLQKNQPDYRVGFWYLGRAISLNIPKSDEVKDYLKKSLAAYQQVPPECLDDQVNDLIKDSATSLKPAAGWKLASAEQVNAIRNELSVKRIFDDLRAGGETAHMMYLASCGTVIGLGDEGPELGLMILEVNQTPGNLVTLLGALTQESADAKKPDVEVKIEGPAEARNLRAEDYVRVSGKITGYQIEPFLLKLGEGNVNPEDIPKTRR